MAAGLNLEALVRVPSVLSYDVAPDGKSIAYVSNISGRREVYRMPLEGGEATKISDGPESKISPEWGPDSKLLGYLQDFQGDENYEIYVYNFETGDTSNITNLPQVAIYPGFDWSPDGQQIAFVSNQEGTFALYIIPSLGGEVERISHHTYSDERGVWSPDGKLLAVSADTNGLESTIFVIPVDGGEERQLLLDGKLFDAGDPEWSPDGKRIAFVSNVQGSNNIGIWHLESNQVQWLTGGQQWDEYSPEWSPDGKALAYILNENGNTKVVIHPVDGGEPRSYQAEQGVHAMPKWTPDGKGIITLFTNSRHTSDLWLLDIASGTWKQLTNSMTAGIDQERLVSPGDVRYRSFDGAEVPALLYKPAQPSKAGVIWIHGGPTAQQMDSWQPAIQYLVSVGYVVLAPNYRGSTGYGKAWEQANRFKLGQSDLADVVAGAEYLVNEGLVNPNQLAVTGGSYGGYMTMMALTKHPNRWCAGVSIVPFLNWFTEYEHEREDLQYFDRQMMGDPVKDYDRWYEVSPINFLDQIGAPVLLLAGANDPRCPAEETEQAIAKLAELGKVFEAHIYPDEGHGFAHIENRIDSIRRQVSFIERYCPIG